jgi:hypothetical protein
VRFFGIFAKLILLLNNESKDNNFMDSGLEKELQRIEQYGFRIVLTDNGRLLKQMDGCRMLFNKSATNLIKSIKKIGTGITREEIEKEDEEIANAMNNMETAIIKAQMILDIIEQSWTEEESDA